MSDTRPKVPMADAPAERAVLAGLLADNRKVPEVSIILKREDFTLEPCALIFEVMVELDQLRRPADTLTLSAALNAKGQLAKVGGLPFLAELDLAAPVAANVVAYAQIVADLALRRRFVATCRAALQDAELTTVDSRALVVDLESKLLALDSEKGSASKLRRLDKVIDESLDHLDKAMSGKVSVQGVPTGIIDLDRKLTGFHPGELIILAARPGVGKSSLAQQAAIHAAEKAGVSAAIFSLEMAGQSLGLRSLASTGRVSLSKLREGRIGVEELIRVNEASAQLYNVPLWIDDASGLDLRTLRTTLRRLVRMDPKLRLVVIDYLQLMGSVGKNREAEVAALSRGLKLLAVELGLPVLALSQLNRKVEERKDGRPMLSDLRDSGAIEQDADVVLFIHAEQPEEEGVVAASEINAEIIVAKQRNGPTGSVPVLWIPQYTRFENRTPAEPPPQVAAGFTKAPEEKEA